jgi:heme exporter protein C
MTQPVLDAPVGTGSRGSRILGVLTLVGLVAVAIFAFGVSPADSELGESIRIMYVHVPTVTAAYVLLIANAVFSGFVLRRRSDFADVAAHTCAELGVLMLGLTLVTGSLWGRITWGTFWEWDARLTTTALLFLLYVGYLALRAATPDPRARATRSAVLGIASAVMIPIVHKSVDWWASLHQEKTLFGTADPSIDGSQLFTLMLSMVTFGLLAGWLAMHRFRVGWLAMQADRMGVDAAIAERRAEGVPA